MMYSKKISVLIFSIFTLANFSFAETIHKVKRGETLYSIGRTYEITVSELRAANNLSEKDILKEGQSLVIPNADIKNAATLSGGASTEKNSNNNSVLKKTKKYTVQKGDTLYGIAKKYDIKVAELYSLNGMNSSDVLKVGQKINVPDEDKKEIAPEMKDIKDLDPRTYTTKNVDSKLIWPVKNPTVTYVNGKVSGVRLSSSSKENVKNIRAGSVVFTGQYRGFGEVVFVQSKTGLVYAYTGLSSVKVQKGDYVVFDDVLGKAGVDSVSKTSGITFMVIQNGEFIDPAKAPRS